MKYRISNSQEILEDTNSHIKNKIPFSLLRGGDGTLGMFSVIFLNGFVKVGHWSLTYNKTNKKLKRMGKPIGEELAKKLLRYVNIPWEKRVEFFENTISYLNEADYIDSFQNYSSKSIKTLANRVLVENWDKILQGVNIDLNNKKFCDPRSNFYLLINNQYNLFDVMKGRNIFYVCNTKFNWLKKRCGASSLSFYLLPTIIDSINGNGLYDQMDLIIEKCISVDADLYLVGGGFVGRNISGKLKQLGKVVIDLGSLFDYWSGKRTDIVLPAIKKMIYYNSTTRLFHKRPKFKSIIL